MEFLKKFLKTLCISENDESFNRKRSLDDDELDSQSNKKVKFEPVWKPQNDDKTLHNHKKLKSEEIIDSDNDSNNNDNITAIDYIKTKLNTETVNSEKELKISRTPSGLEDFVIVN